MNANITVYNTISNILTKNPNNINFNTFRSMLTQTEFMYYIQ